MSSPEAPATSAEDVQRRLAAAVRSYVAREQEGGPLPAFPADAALSATEVATVCLALLASVEMDIFELQMWQSLGRRG